MAHEVLSQSRKLNFEKKAGETLIRDLRVTMPHFNKVYAPSDHKNVVTTL